MRGRSVLIFGVVVETALVVVLAAAVLVVITAAVDKTVDDIVKTFVCFVLVLLSLSLSLSGGFLGGREVFSTVTLFWT